MPRSKPKPIVTAADLMPREKQLILLLMEGLTHKAIATRWNVGHLTVRDLSGKLWRRLPVRKDADKTVRHQIIEWWLTQ